MEPFIDLIEHATLDEVYYWLGLAAAFVVVAALAKVLDRIKKGGAS